MASGKRKKDTEYHIKVCCPKCDKWVSFGGYERKYLGDEFEDKKDCPKCQADIRLVHKISVRPKWKDFIL